MKTQHLIIGMVMFLMTLGACREITVTTTVNRDGSFTRMITVSGDSADAFKKELPYPVDASWAMTSKKDSAGKEKFIVTYTKQYNDIAELKAEIGSDTSWLRHLGRSIDISKRFGFFYSCIEYNETYRAANPFTLLPYRDYLTPGDLLWLTRRHPVGGLADSVRQKEAEDKVMDYLVESATAEVEKVLADGIRTLNDPALNATSVAKYHDRISSALSKWNLADVSLFIDSLRVWTGNNAVDRLREVNPPLFNEFNRKAALLENLLKMENFRVETELPGLITGTNSATLKGNRVTWEVMPMEFLLSDYSMTAESRVINVWAFILTGMVVCGLIGLLVVKSFKR